MNITNDKVTEYIHEYYKPLNENLAQLREMAEEDIIPIILKETELFMNTMFALKKPAKILEIGTAIGYSAMYFAEKCPDAQIYTVEKDWEVAQTAVHNVRTCGLSDRIHVYVGDGQEQIEKMQERGISDFDFVFIDASKSHYKRFFDTALTVCTDDAIIVSDNILMHGMTVSAEFDPKDKHRTNIKNMREYVDYICDEERFATSLYSIGDGLAVTLLRGENE